MCERGLGESQTRAEGWIFFLIIATCLCFAALLLRSMCEINLEAELFTLQDSNAKLVEALQEANSGVEQWKRQLAEYQEETDRLRDQVTAPEKHKPTLAVWKQTDRCLTWPRFTLRTCTL